MWKENAWNAYRVVIEVQNEDGRSLEQANILTTARQSRQSNQDGRTTLYFSQTGLHIIMVKAEGMYTKQIKIRIPEDADKIVLLTLKSKKLSN